MLKFVLGIGAGLLLAWLMLVAVLALSRPRGSLLTESLRIIPDTLRLVRRLATDAELPWEVRARLWFLLAYLACPIDLVPDFIPIVGIADDAILVCLVLRSVLRRAGPEPLRRHWPGTAAGLAVLWRVASLDGSPAP